MGEQQAEKAALEAATKQLQEQGLITRKGVVTVAGITALLFYEKNAAELKGTTAHAITLAKEVADLKAQMAMMCTTEQVKRAAYSAVAPYYADRIMARLQGGE